MQEYERAETTVLNSYVRPQVSSYVNNLQSNLEKSLGSDVQLSILRYNLMVGLHQVALQETLQSITLCQVLLGELRAQYIFVTKQVLKIS